MTLFRKAIVTVLFLFLIPCVSFGGDFNNDGKQDLVWLNSDTGNVGLWLMDGGSILQVCIIATVEQPKWNINFVGDLNGDGKSDIVFTTRSTSEPQVVFVWLMDGCSIIESKPVGAVDPSWGIEPS